MLPDRPWQTFQEPGTVREHTMILGGVLCRWWGENEPPGAKILEGIYNALNDKSYEIERALRDLLYAHIGRLRNLGYADEVIENTWIVQRVRKVLDE